MKTKGILNSDISRVLSYMGHTDKICISDCGLPVPDCTERIDLALTLGNPSFEEVLNAVCDDMKIQTVYIAEEMKKFNTDGLKKIQDKFKDIRIVFISHEELKEMTKECKAVIRSGENTPYSNIILESDCIF